MTFTRPVHDISLASLFQECRQQEQRSHEGHIVIGTFTVKAYLDNILGCRVFSQQMIKVRLKVPGLYVLWISTAVNLCYPAYTLLPAETYHLSRIAVMLDMVHLQLF